MWVVRIDTLWVVRIDNVRLTLLDEIQKSEKCVKSVGAYANAYAF